jgi:hypothetical protein
LNDSTKDEKEEKEGAEKVCTSAPYFDYEYLTFMQEVFDLRETCFEKHYTAEEGRGQPYRFSCLKCKDAQAKDDVRFSNVVTSTKNRIHTKYFYEHYFKHHLADFLAIDYRCNNLNNQEAMWFVYTVFSYLLLFGFIFSHLF